MTSTLFLAFAAAWTALLAWRLWRHLGSRVLLPFLAGLALWLAYASALALKGLLVSEALPPRIALILAPIIGFAAWTAVSKAGAVAAAAIPLRELVGLQGFRVIVELFLHQLWQEGLVNRAMTFRGHNFDILTGLFAIALYIFWNRLPNVVALVRAWNYFGLATLAIIVATGIGSVPGPTHFFNWEPPNLAVTMFPYVLIPALFVVSALSLHVLAFRKIAASADPEGIDRELAGSRAHACSAPRESHRP